MGGWEPERLHARLRHTHNGVTRVHVAVVEFDVVHASVFVRVTLVFIETMPKSAVCRSTRILE